MCGEFVAVVRGYRVNELPVREKQPGHDFRRRRSLFYPPVSQRHRVAVRVMPSLYPGRCPGLTENGSALRTTNHVDLLLKTKATAKVRFLRDSGSVAEATAEGRLYNHSPRLACLPGVGRIIIIYRRRAVV